MVFADAEPCIERIVLLAQNTKLRSPCQITAELYMTHPLDSAVYLVYAFKTCASKGGSEK